MALILQEPVVERGGVPGLVVSKYDSSLPSEVERRLGYWEASNSNQIPQWYLDPSLALDGERNIGRVLPAFSTWTNFMGITADWSQAREFCGSGPHDGVPYTEYGVKRLEIRYSPKGPVTTFATNGAGATRVTTGVHGLANGRTVLIYDSADYDGFYTIFNVTPTTFDIIKAFTMNEAGRWGTASASQIGAMEEITEESITGFQMQRAPAIDKTGALVESGKLNHPHIP